MTFFGKSIGTREYVIEVWGRLIVQVDDHRNPKYNGTMDAFRKVFAAEGVKGLYRGFGPAMARSVPANAACFLAYELVRESLG